MANIHPLVHWRVYQSMPTIGTSMYGALNLGIANEEATHTWIDRKTASRQLKNLCGDTGRAKNDSTQSHKVYEYGYITASLCGRVSRHEITDNCRCAEKNLTDEC